MATRQTRAKPRKPASAPNAAAPGTNGQNSSTRRSVAAIHGYNRLIQKARTNSRWWFVLKVVQGVLFGGLLLALGLLARLVGLFSSPDSIWHGLATGLMLLAVFVFLRYLLAPLTAAFVNVWSGPDQNILVYTILNLFCCSWNVLVQQNWFYIVLDADDFAYLFIGQGWNAIPWRWNLTVRQYTDCSFVQVDGTNVEVKNVLHTNMYPVTVQVTASFTFDPTKAERSYFGTLRQLGDPDASGKIDVGSKLTGLVAGYVLQVVNMYLNQPARTQGFGMAGYDDNAPALQQHIEQRMAAFGKAMGLKPIDSDPIVVSITMPSTAMWLLDRLDRAQSVQDLRKLAADNNLSFEDALQLLRMRPRGSRSSRRGRSREKVVVINTQATRVSDAQAPSSVPPAPAPGAPPAAEPPPVDQAAEEPVETPAAQPAPVEVSQEDSDAVAQYMKDHGFPVDMHSDRRRLRLAAGKNSPAPAPRRDRRHGG